MTTARPKPRCPSKHYHAFVVQPEKGFEPRSWQDKPKNYRIIEYLGAKRFRGPADAWRFMHNRSAIEAGNWNRWAIYVE